MLITTTYKASERLNSMHRWGVTPVAPGRECHKITRRETADARPVTVTQLRLDRARGCRGSGSMKYPFHYQHMNYIFH